METTFLWDWRKVQYLKAVRPFWKYPHCIQYKHIFLTVFEGLAQKSTLEAANGLVSVILPNRLFEQSDTGTVCPMQLWVLMWDWNMSQMTLMALMTLKSRLQKCVFCDSWMLESPASMTPELYWRLRLLTWSPWSPHMQTWFYLCRGACLLFLQRESSHGAIIQTGWAAGKFQSGGREPRRLFFVLIRLSFLLPKNWWSL